MIKDLIKTKEVNGKIHVSVIEGVKRVPLLRANLGIVKVYLAAEQTSIGPEHGNINLPGNIIGWFLNVEIEVFFQHLLFGHWNII